jgi:hypothetical protein
VVFRTAALTSLVAYEAPASKCLAATPMVQCAFWLSANPPQDGGPGQGSMSSGPLAGFDLAGALPSIDRRTTRRGRGTAIDEQFLTLHMRGIV